MKRLLVTGFALVLLVPACAFAQSMFNGTWKLDPTTVHMIGGKPMVVTLKNGWFTRSNANPPIRVKADGKFHKVTGHKHFDAAAIDVINNHTVRETDKKDGKVVSTDTVTVAPNGKTATVEGSHHSGPTHFTAKELVRRVAKGAPGSNAVAGSWRLDRVVNASANYFAPTFKIEGSTVTASDGASDGYTAKLGGKPVPNRVNGKKDGMVAVAMLGNNTLQETYTKHGKVTRTSTMTISANGKTMLMADHNMKNGGTTTMLHYKQ